MVKDVHSGTTMTTAMNITVVRNGKKKTDYL